MGSDSHFHERRMSFGSADRKMLEEVIQSLEAERAEAELAK